MIRDTTLRQSGIALLSVLVVLAPLSVAPVAGQTSTAPPTPEHIEIDGEPSFVVMLEDGAAEDLRTWAESGDGRTVVEMHDGWAVISAPPVLARDVGFPAALGSPFLAATTDPLSARPWVESVAPNLEHQYVEPESSLLEEDDYDAPELPLGAKLSTKPTGAVNPKGIAFSSDANRTTMAESRAITGTDSTSRTGAGVTVAVIDTGVNTASGQIFGNGSVGSNVRLDPDSKNFITNETVYAEGRDAISDGNGHGTWVSSSIAANASGTVHDGIAPDAQILGLKALADDGSGSTADIVEAVRYAVDNDADIISMSLGSPIYDPALASAIKYAEDNGVVVVVAAGNSRQTVRWTGSPADADYAIAVAATNGKAPSDAESAYFSQIGPDPGVSDGSEGVTNGGGPDIAAPGMETVARVATTTGSTTNSTLSGTSMATPMVSGAIAVALEEHPDWTPSQVRKWVRESARPMPNAGVTEVGAGMVSADRMVSKTVAPTDQADARTDTAVARDRFYRRLSEGRGGLVAGLVNDLF
jgi:subtilisin family serine protease